MRILFDNYVNNSTISANSQDGNYPVTNIKDQFLKKIFKSTQTTDVVTINFGSVKDVDCCYVGLTNAIGITLQLYNASSGLIATKSIDPSTFGGCFAKVTGVLYCVITFVSTSNIYIGNIGVGLAYEMPDPLNNIIKGKVDNSDIYASKDGQFSKNKVQWLRKVKTSHYVLSIDEYNEIYSLFADNERPVWVDVYEELKNGILPIYAQVEFNEDSQQWRKYNFNVTSTEAR